MNMQSTSGLLCPCKLDRINYGGIDFSREFLGSLTSHLYWKRKRRRRGFEASMLSTNNDRSGSSLGYELGSSVRRSTEALVSKGLSDELNYNELGEDPVRMSSKFASFENDPLVDKLRTQLGVIHPIPTPPISRGVAGLFILFFFVGVLFDKVWTSTKRKQKLDRDERSQGIWPQVPTSFSLFLEKDLQRKESVEWVNMVLGKLWKVYRPGLEDWVIGLLQPVIDDLKKPDYVQRVEIKQFSLGEEPLSVRNVERRTSRRVNDLQYQIGIRYTGGARMLLMLSLKFSIIPIVVPVTVRDFDIDGELWVKLRLIPSGPWIGAASWAFVTLPKIKFKLSPFRLFNLMAIPVLSMFLTKLLTEDLPLLFVRPRKIVLDFQKGKAVGLVPNDFKSGDIQEGNKDCVGELSVTLVDARKLSYAFYGKTDPYVVLTMGDQVIRSKKNSQTTVIGAPGQPIWNQDFDMLVENPRKQKLCIQVKDSFGFTDLTIGTGEVELGSLQDTVPTDRIVTLQGGWGLFKKGSSGEILLRLTYKAYVEDEEDDRTVKDFADNDTSDDETDSDEPVSTFEESQITSNASETDSFMNVLAALLVSEEFQGIVASEAGNIRNSKDASKSASTLSGQPSRTAESIPFNSEESSSENSGGQPGRTAESVPINSEESSSKNSGGSALIWLAVITSVAVLIALNVGGSSFFNP